MAVDQEEMSAAASSYPIEPDLFGPWFEYTLVLDTLKRKAAQLRGEGSVLLDGVASDFERLRGQFEAATQEESRRKVRVMFDAEVARQVEAEVSRRAVQEPAVQKANSSQPAIGAMQRTIAALTLLISESSTEFRSGCEPKLRAIAEEAERAALRAKYGDPVPASASIRGMSDETFRKVIAAAMSEFAAL